MWIVGDNTAFQHEQCFALLQCSNMSLARMPTCIIFQSLYPSYSKELIDSVMSTRGQSYIHTNIGGVKVHFCGGNIENANVQ